MLVTDATSVDKERSRFSPFAHTSFHGCNSIFT